MRKPANYTKKIGKIKFLPKTLFFDKITKNF